MKKLVIVVLIISIGGAETWAQKKSLPLFKMSNNAQYSKGSVLVKIKPEYKNMFAPSSSNGRTQGFNGAVVSPLTPRAYSDQAQTGRLSPPTIDITSYYKLSFDASVDVESYINELYSMGYFEIVEPNYVYKSQVVPNDPSVGNQYHLQTIKAFEAWDIAKGSTNSSVAIAIIDSGGELDHPDLKDNLFVNTKEIPGNSVDDDNNGYVDDVQGWDFIGGDTLNVNNPNFSGDNNVRITKGGDISHGTWTAGCAGASTNNGIGVAGVSYNTKLLFTKHSADNQKTTSPSVYNGYSGLLYAANLGIKIINCSFGGTSRSQIIQDVINFVTLDLGCLVVSSAGNDNSSEPNYPAAYDNVLSVSATDSNDKKASFSNYGSTVDIAAPGVNILTTGYKSVYQTQSGTSFSSPIVAGAAALVWAKNPTFTAQQVAEQLRVTADETALNAANPGFVRRLGKGRLNIQNALTQQFPSIRASNSRLVNSNGLAAQPGDKAFLSFNFTNYLKATSSGLQITITSSSSFASISKGTVSPGSIASGSTLSNKLTPFELTINAGASEDASVDLLITYSDGAYTDYQFVSFLVNRSFIDIDKNNITTTITGIGRIGFADVDGDRLKGSGFNFSNSSMLYEMGLIMGTSSANIFNNVRGINSQVFDQDFLSINKIKEILPGDRSDNEVYGSFNDSRSTGQEKISVGYRSLAWKEKPYDRFVILEYKVKNPTTQPIDGFHFGIFADWDITTDGREDAADWDNENKLGYVYPATSAAKPIGGIQVLTGTPEYYAIDNLDANAGADSFGLYNSTTSSFTDAEKFITISSGLKRLNAGKNTSTGNDVSHVVSSGPYNIGPGQEITLAFALHAGANLTDLKSSAKYADSVYNYTLKAAKPTADGVSTCYGQPAVLNANGATKIKWYKDFTGGTAIATGNQFTTGNLFNDTILYVSNAEKSFESVRTPIRVSVKANPIVATSGSTTLCEGQSVILSANEADAYLWSTGAITKTIEVKTAGDYSVTVRSTSLNCQATSKTISVKVNPTPTAKFAAPASVGILATVSFTDQSTDAISWAWDFGDGNKSSLQNPTNTFKNISDVIVKLTVTAANGCTNSVSSPISVITGQEDVASDQIFAFPNPISGQVLTVEIPSGLIPISARIVTTFGKSLFAQEFSVTSDKVVLQVPVSEFPAGMYIVQVKTKDGLISKKVVKNL